MPIGIGLGALCKPTRISSTSQHPRLNDVSRAGSLLRWDRSEVSPSLAPLVVLAFVFHNLPSWTLPLNSPHKFLKLDLRLLSIQPKFTAIQPNVWPLFLS